MSILTKTKNRFWFLLALMVLTHITYSQKITSYKINDLLNRVINSSDTVYVVNFWATWCKPCVAELPDFNRLDSVYKLKKVKVLLVSLDFKEDISSKLIPFIKKHNYHAEIIVLDESNGNNFINKISEKWSGAIPATLITQRNKNVEEFYEKKLSYGFLVERLQAKYMILDQ
jgi:thiol-disulfide isomerase/thioredoxin